MLLAPTPLSYKHHELEPILSEYEVATHYTIHTQQYFDVVNTLIEGTAYQGKELDTLVSKPMLMQMDSKLYTNLCQCWNHDFYWKSMAPPGAGGQPSEELKKALVESFGSYDNFVTLFTTKAKDTVGSGWCWLVCDGASLRIKVTPNTSLPQSTDGGIPILVCDLWEHAYLYDKQYVAKRAQYVGGFIELINWAHANKVYKDVTK